MVSVSVVEKWRRVRYSLQSTAVGATWHSSLRCRCHRCVCLVALIRAEKVGNLDEREMS